MEEYLLENTKKWRKEISIYREKMKEIEKDQKV